MASWLFDKLCWWKDPFAKPSTAKPSEFDRLPNELIFKIFGYCGIPELKTCKLTCTTWDYLIEEWQLVGPKCCVAFQDTIFTPAKRPVQHPLQLTNREPGKLTAFTSPHFGRFARDALPNLYSSTLRLSGFLWVNFSKSTLTSCIYHSNRLMEILEDNPNMAKQIEHLDYRNNYFHNFISPFSKMLSVLPNLQSLTFEETRDYVDRPDFLADALYPAWNDAQQNWEQDEQVNPDMLVQAGLVQADGFPIAAASCLENLTSFTAKDSLREDRRRQFGSTNHWFYSPGSNSVLRCLSHVAVYSKNLVSLDIQDGRFKSHFLITLASHYMTLFECVRRIIVANASTLRHLKLSTVNIDDIRRVNSEVKFQPANPEDRRTSYDKPCNGDGLIFQEFIQVLSGAFPAFLFGDRPPSPPWAQHGLSLETLELKFFVARLNNATNHQLSGTRTFTGHLLNFLESQTKLQKFRLGQLCIMDEAIEAKTALLNRIVAACPDQCHVTMDVAEQLGKNMTVGQYATWLNDFPARQKERDEGYTSDNCPVPISFTKDEVIAREESFVKLTEHTVNWNFYYVDWKDLNSTIIHSNASNLTKIQIRQADISGSQRAQIKDADLQKIIAGAKSLKSLCLEHCNMDGVSDAGLTGRGIGTGDNSHMMAGTTGRPISALEDLHTLKLIGVGSKVTDTSAQLAFNFPRLRRLVLTVPNFTEAGVNALRNNLRIGGSSSTWIKIFTADQLQEKLVPISHNIVKQHVEG